ncbi:MAG: hypothetical protein J3Q66DRAFT_438760 [Benniella sp.]|nr:MAG: hypothetical protein J3Q66DRAFT_438760 [Benniella sp.]
MAPEYRTHCCCCIPPRAGIAAISILLLGVTAYKIWIYPAVFSEVVSMVSTLLSICFYGILGLLGVATAIRSTFTLASTFSGLWWFFSAIINIASLAELFTLASEGGDGLERVCRDVAERNGMNNVVCDLALVIAVALVAIQLVLALYFGVFIRQFVRKLDVNLATGKIEDSSITDIQMNDIEQPR